MSRPNHRVLLIGYGNPGRQDDGLGPALADAMESRQVPELDVESDYQLTVEDAMTAATHAVVIFADADVSGPEPFSFRRLAPSAGSGYGSHGVEPGEVIGLAETLFGGKPEAYVLGIRGYAFDEFGEGLSERARANLAAAAEFVERAVRERSFARDAEDDGPRACPGCLIGE